MENNLKDTIFENEENLKKCKEVFIKLIQEYNERSIEDFFSYTQTNIIYYDLTSKQNEIPTEEAETIMTFISLVRFWLKEYNRLTKDLQNRINDITIVSKDFLLSEYRINVLKEKKEELIEDLKICEAVYQDEEALKIIVSDEEHYKSFKERFEKHLASLINDREKTAKELEEANKVYSIGRFFDINSEEYKEHNELLLNKLIDVYLAEALTIAYKDMLEYTIKLLGIENETKINYIEMDEMYRGNMVDTIGDLLEMIKRNNYNIYDNIELYSHYKGLLDYKYKKMTKAKIKSLNIYSKKTAFNFVEVLDKIVKDRQKEISLHIASKGVINGE